MISIASHKILEEPWYWPEGAFPNDPCIIEDEERQTSTAEEAIDIWEELVSNKIDHHVPVDSEILVYKLNPLIPAALYYIPSTGKRVQSFLDHHPSLHSVLNQARWQIYRYFGSVPVSLDIQTYHDESSNEELVVYIHTSLTVDEAMDRLDSLLEEWWIDSPYQIKGELGFDLRFK